MNNDRMSRGPRDERFRDDRYDDRDADDPRHSKLSVAGHGLAKGARGLGRVTVKGTKATARAARRASTAEGAGESGLSRLIEVHAASMAGDAAVTVGLAGTVFFAAPSGQAQGQTLRFLVLTMLPFAIVAPLLAPLLDRLRHGRRWAIGATLAIRAFLCWVLAGAIESNSTMLFPIAMGVLVSSKAYLVTRSAAAPRLLPRGMTLVKANARLSLAGVAGAAIGGPLAGVASKVVDPAWALRVAFVLFVIGTILAILLPPRVDSATGEEGAGAVSAIKPKVPMPTEVISALRANAGLRWLSGFLTVFLAFLMRNHPFPGWEDRKTLLLGLVVGAAGLGNALGTVMGSLLKVASPRIIVVVTLVADAVMIVVAALFFDFKTAVLVGLVAGIGQQLGKLALDSIIQDRIPEHMRTSVFGRSETLVQLSWVLGGIVAVVMPTDRADIGMFTAAIVLVLWAAAVLIWQSGRSIPVAGRAAARADRADRDDRAERADYDRGHYDRRGYRRPAADRTRELPDRGERPSYGDRGRRASEPTTAFEGRAATPSEQRAPGGDKPFDYEETIAISREQVRRYRPENERDDRPRWERDLDED